MNVTPLEYLTETVLVVGALDLAAIDEIAIRLRRLKGRLFLLGVGGSAATASHAASDLRKFAHIECYCATDNVTALTATTNDSGWRDTFVEWLDTSRLTNEDAVFVLSVGGGTSGVSPNIWPALRFAKDSGAQILGVVGRDGGVTAKLADVCVVIPPMFAERVTFHTEECASIVMHLLTARCS